MNIIKGLKGNSILFLIYIILLIPLFFLLKENFLRSLFLITTLTGWLVISINKNAILSSLLFILFVLPFNITYQLPLHVLFFDTNPYVNGLYSNYLVPTLSVLDLGIFLLFVSFCNEYKWKQIKELLYQYIPYIIVFLIFLIVQFVLNPTLLELVSTTRLFMYSISVPLVINWIKNENHGKERRYFIDILFIGVLSQGLVGVMQFIRGSSLGLEWLGESVIVSGMQGSSFVTLNNEIFLRAYGTFPHPNVLAGYFLIIILLSFVLLKSGNKDGKIIIWILVILSFLFIWFTFSRIGISLSLLLLLVLVLSQLKGLKLFSFTPILFLQRFANLFIGGDTSLVDRIGLIKSSWEVFKDNWLIGIGGGNFTRGMVGNYPLTQNGLILIQPVHNVFLLMLSEIGIAGSVIYILFLIKVVTSNVKRMTWVRWILIFVFIVVGSFDHYIWSLPQGNIVGLLMLVLMCI